MEEDQEEINNVYCHCSECPKPMEIISLDNNIIKFKCINKKDTHEKEMLLRDYIIKIKLNKKCDIYDSCLNHQSKYKYFCVDCNKHLCEECLESRVKAPLQIMISSMYFSIFGIITGIFSSSIPRSLNPFSRRSLFSAIKAAFFIFLYQYQEVNPPSNHLQKNEGKQDFLFFLPSCLFSGRSGKERIWDFLNPE